ncbi:MAG: molecular chaperone DnaK [Deltaproteobacteria bacterium]|nr:molecular chaperone DnaK [Deltaproteobacteria bacterium]MCL5791800.1 molecular chaperone DnaK [Deltaproteobacteria bacterium]
MGKVIGIDLGTTNTCAATIIAGKPFIIPSSTGSRLIPSYFAITKDDKILVGARAKRQVITNPRNTIFAAKRLIGRRFESNEVKLAKERLPYEIVAGPHGDTRVVCGRKVMSIPEISAGILLEVKRIAEEFLDDEIEGVCITVPAYFNENQRQATKDAAEITGLKVLRIINEPTASAIAYGQKYNKKNGLIAIYDLGGGTFDISILEFGEGVYEVLSTSGNTYLGGEDIDNLLIKYITDEFNKKNNTDLSKDVLAMQRLKDAAERAKIDLSVQTEVHISLPFLTESSRGPVHLNTTITRQELEELMKDLIERTILICKEAIEKAEIKVEDIDSVMLVGGQTRSPLVAKMVTDFFGKQPNKNINPDEVVAEGAAIHAYNITSPLPSNILVDITALSLGIETKGGAFVEIIVQNSTVPVTKKRRFTTTYDNQNAVRVSVFQGVYNFVKDNELLGEFVLSGIRPAKKGEPNIDVIFDLNGEGILTVSAVDSDTGAEQSVMIEGRTGLTKSEIDEIKNRITSLEIELKEI